MASLPPIRRLRIEDFASQKSWIEPLILVFNAFTEAVVVALNKGLTIAENSTGDIKTMTLSGTFPVSTSWTKTTQPVAVLVGDAKRTDGTTVTITDAIGITWSMSADGKSLQVDSIVGITPSTSATYELTLVCHAG